MTRLYLNLCFASSVNILFSHYIYLSIYLSISIYIYLSICIYLSVYIYLSFSLYIYLSISIYLYLYLSIYLSVCLFCSVLSYYILFYSICLYVCLYVYLPISFPVVHRLLSFRLHTFPFIACSVLNSSASSPSHFLFPLRVVLVVVVFLLVTRSLFAWAIFYPPCVLLVHNVSA